MKTFLKLTAASLLLSTAAFAQATMPAPANPLRPAAPPAVTAPSVTMPKTEVPKAEMPKVVNPAKKAEEAVAKPKRERSEKQKANDNIMSKCGADWRAEKAAGKTGTTQWRDYLQTCRKKNKPA